MKILIIGANSYVGARIYFELSKEHEVIGTYFSNKLSDKFLQLDITKKANVRQLITDKKPGIIIHVANNANPRWCEANKEECIRPLFILGFSPNTINDRPFNRLLKNLDQKIPAIYDTSWKVQCCYLGHLCEVIEILIQRNYWNDTISVGIKDLKTRYDTAKDILGAFGIKVEPTDGHDLTPIIEVDLSHLSELHLPVYSYGQMIEKIILEIKNREQFKI